MGLLDDAIREHLELKRKHGAAEDELLRKETEALGPARRDFAAPPADEAPAAEATPAEAEAPPEPEPAGWLDDDSGGAPFDAAAGPVESLRPAAEPEPVPLEDETAAEPAPAPPRVEPPPAEPPPAEPPPRRVSDTPTEGFPAVARHDEPDDGDQEDVLEETPEFLQDTPEHDRLWFEQKPPRDFDFDD